MHLHLGGHLSWYDARRRAWVEIHIDAPTPLADVLRQLNVPVDEVAVTAVQGRAVDVREAIVSYGDRVEVYPPIGGGV